MRANPIFIHAMFRTGSTYIWNKFRRLPRYVCYYEPFHQLLSGITPKNIKNTLTQDFKAAGHPELAKYYLYEYEALVKENEPGVPFFRKELSFDWFCLPAGEPNPYQKRYVDFLIQAAGDKIPLFKFNRTALRSGWFKSFYPGSLNVYLHRNPREQWQSYRAIEARSGYDKFFLMDLIALSKNRENALVRPLAAAVPLFYLNAPLYADEELFYRTLCQAYAEKERYFIFYYLWLVSLCENAMVADMLWDINALARDEAYRKKVNEWLTARKVDPIDFSDCRITSYSDFQLPPTAMAEIEAQAQELIAGVYTKANFKRIAAMLPPEVGKMSPLQKEKKTGQFAPRPADERQGDWLKIADKMTDWLMDDWLQKEKDIRDLRRALKRKDEQLSRSSDLLAQEVQKVEKKKQESETLTRALAEKSELIKLLQSDAEKKRHETEMLTGALAEKNKSLNLLQGDVEKKRQEMETLAGTLAEKKESLGLLQGDVERKRQKIDMLAATLAERSESLARLQNDLKKKGREIETLTGVLAEKNGSLGLLQGDLKKQKQELNTMSKALAEKSKSLAQLQARVDILLRSYAYRIGRTVLFPWRTAKNGARRLKRMRPARPAGRSKNKNVRSADSPERKIMVADQMVLNFGRHRSGLKYGLEQLKTLHRSDGVILDAFIERTFCWGPERKTPYAKSWIGFIHVPPNTPAWYHPEQHNRSIFRSEQWQESLPLCRGIFTFSDYHRRELQPLLPKVPLEALRLPSEIPERTWSWEAFQSNREKKVVQVGWWLRRLHAIYQLPPTAFQKVFLHAGHRDITRLLAIERSILDGEGSLRPDMKDAVQRIPFLTNSEYDALLSQNIAFMFLYDVSASNAIVECMVRRTPLLVNPLEAVVEYLGESYPFYFQSLEEAAVKLADVDLIFRTHQYLKDHPLTRRLTGKTFFETFCQSGIYRSLKIP